MGFTNSSYYDKNWNKKTKSVHICWKQYFHVSEAICNTRCSFLRPPNCFSFFLSFCFQIYRKWSQHGIVIFPVQNNYWFPPLDIFYICQNANSCFSWILISATALYMGRKCEFIETIRPIDGLFWMVLMSRNVTKLSKLGHV